MNKGSEILKISRVRWVLSTVFVGLQLCANIFFSSIYSMKDAGRYTCRIHNKKQQCLFTESCDVTIVENPNPPTFSPQQSQIPLSVMHHDRLART